MARKKRTAPKVSQSGRPFSGTEDIFRKFGSAALKTTNGQQAYYAKMPLAVLIGDYEIENGVPGSHRRCILALSVDAALNDPNLVVAVTSTQVRISDPVRGKILIFRIPRALQTRLRDFDKTEFIGGLLPGWYYIDPHPKPLSPKERARRAERAAPQPVRTSRRRKRYARPTRRVHRGKIVWANDKKSA